MPIKIPNELPATKTLLEENIFVITETRALTQDIRPLKILILNLMPTKIVTETQLARLLGNTPLQVEMELLKTESHVAKNTSEEHMLAFYKTFSEVKGTKVRRYDYHRRAGRAPCPLSRSSIGTSYVKLWTGPGATFTSTFHICWGAQAALYHHYGIDKRPLAEKMFGVFPHHVEHKGSMLLRGFDDTFMVPHSRHTTIAREDIEAVQALENPLLQRGGGRLSLSPQKGAGRSLSPAIRNTIPTR